MARADKSSQATMYCEVADKSVVFWIVYLQEITEFIFEEISPKHLLSKKLCIELTG